MVGRDIGTVVLPNADLKIYLTASARGTRPAALHRADCAGCRSDYEEILAGIRQRDQTDSSRKASPLKPAADAVILDCTSKSIDETLEAIAQLTVL